VTPSPSPPRPPSVERLVFFSDAAVAIALTLLILPLMDGVGDAAREGLDAFGYLGRNLSALVSFVLSFVIIARFWRSHHRLFSALEWEPPGLFWLNMVWLLSIVFLPVATAITGAMPVDRPQLVVYIGTMLVAVLSLTVMEMVAWRHRDTWAEGARVSRDAIHASWSMVILMVVALAVALAWPVIGYWALLLLLLSHPVKVLLDRADNR
jgi:uncharacterized membrane protein